jgi:hypothetical protein
MSFGFKIFNEWETSLTASESVKSWTEAEAV